MNIQQLRAMLDEAAMGVGEDAEAVLVDEQGQRHEIGEAWLVWGGEGSKVKIPIRKMDTVDQNEEGTGR